MDREYYFNINGELVPNEEAMVALLLEEDVLFVSSRKYVDYEGEEQGETLVLFINVNDIFGPGADAECLSLEELPVIFKLYEEWDFDGVIKFVCLKRNLLPWKKRTIDRMKSEGHWDDELEKLL